MARLSFVPIAVTVLAALLLLGSIAVCAQTTTTAAPGNSTNKSNTTATKRVTLEWQAYLSIAVCVAVLTALMLDLVTCVGAMICASTLLTICGVITFTDLLSGFSNSGVATIALLFVVADPIAELPAVQRVVAAALGSSDGSASDGSPTSAVRWPLFKIIVMCLLTSSFLNNAPQVALLTNLIKIYCRDHGMYPSQFLMPMNFATLVGNYAIIGTSTNLIVDGLMLKFGMGHMEFFELIKINGIFTPVMLLYLVFMPKYLLPTDKGGMFRIINSDEMRQFVTRLRVAAGSPVIGLAVRTVMDVLPETLHTVEMVQILRGEECFFPLNGIETIEEDDILLVRGNAAQVRDLVFLAGLVHCAAAAIKDKDAGGDEKKEDDKEKKDDAPATAIAPSATATASAGVEMTVRPPSSSDLAADGNDRAAQFAAAAAAARLRQPSVHLPRQQSTDKLGALAVHGHGTTPSNLSFRNTFGSLAAAVTAHGPAPAAAAAAADSNGPAAASGDAAGRATAHEPTTYFEVVISGRCPHVGEAMLQRGFEHRYGCLVLALRCAQSTEDLIGDHLDQHMLAHGDVLLIMAHAGFRDEWLHTGEFIIINAAKGATEATVRDHYVKVPKWFPCGTLIKKEQQEPVLKPTAAAANNKDDKDKQDGDKTTKPTEPVAAAAGEENKKIDDDGTAAAVTAATSATAASSEVADDDDDDDMIKVLLVPWWYKYLTVPVFLIMISLAIAGYDIALCALCATIFLVLIGLASIDQAIAAIDWEVVIMVAFSFGLGSAMEKSGFAAWLGQVMKDADISGLPLLYLIGLFSVIMTNVITNKACVQVLIPLIIAIYRADKQDPLPGVILCCSLASMALSTPYGFATNLMVMGPGGYSAADFIKFGVPLNLLALGLMPLITYGVYFS